MFDQPAVRLAAQIRNGALSAADVLEAYFERVDARNPALNAIVWQDRDSARTAARTLDKEAAQGVIRGPLHGLPMTLKDTFDLAGAPSTWGVPAWRGNIAAHDSDAAARVKAAGAVVFGKTNVPLKLSDWQTFNEIYGVTNNPWDLSRAPGGSSGGAAAALAAGMTALEIGSDIGASIRNPSHYCGVFGLKPTWGAVSITGHAPPGWIADFDINVGGPMARSAEDLSALFEVIAGPSRFDESVWSPAKRPDDRTRLSEFRVGVKRDDPEAPVDRAYLEVLDAFVEDLAKAGATVIECAPEVDSAEHFTLYLRLLGAAMSPTADAADRDAAEALLAAHPDPVFHRTFGVRVGGSNISHREWLKLDNQRRSARMTFDAFFQDVDILITPVCCSTAFAHDHAPHRYLRKIPVNGALQTEALQMFWAGYSGMVGLPSVVGPAGFAHGLPAGYQGIAGHGRDRTALAFAQAVEHEIRGFTPPPG